MRPTAMHNNCYKINHFNHFVLYTINYNNQNQYGISAFEIWKNLILVHSLKWQSVLPMKPNTMISSMYPLCMYAYGLVNQTILSEWCFSIGDYEYSYEEKLIIYN